VFTDFISKINFYYSTKSILHCTISVIMGSYLVVVPNNSYPIVLLPDDERPYLARWLDETTNVLYTVHQKRLDTLRENLNKAVAECFRLQDLIWFWMKKMHTAEDIIEYTNARHNWNSLVSKAESAELALKNVQTELERAQDNAKWLKIMLSGSRQRLSRYGPKSNP
jgi:hypothetical protein